jgi:hypothetical protein
MTRRDRLARGTDPVRKFQDESVWSGYTNSWNRFATPSKRARAFVLGMFGFLVLVGIISIIIALAAK